MKLLALSDIHGNVSAVRDLRAREENVFDGIIVAGDIGSDYAVEIFSILSTFHCPVFYVYGNHDWKLDYDAQFAEDCHHLHLNALSHGSLTLCGFSGCAANWGKNPLAEKALAAVEFEFRHMLAELEEAQKTLELARTGIQIARPLVQAAYDVALRTLEAKAKESRIDRRTTAYRKKVDRLSIRYTCSTWKYKAPVAKIEASKEYRDYINQIEKAYDEIPKLNRQALKTVIEKSGARRDALWIITHERITRISDDFRGMPFFLFGHRHGFTDNYYQGSRFINVSPLDRNLVFRPKHLDKFKWKDCIVVNAGTYGIIEAQNSGEVRVIRKDFQIPGDEDWVIVPPSWYVYGGGGMVVGIGPCD